MPVCDGCGAQVDDAHIRQRIERLELATRFRPVHISVLLIDAAPPARFEDYFYSASANGSERSPASRAYFNALVRCAGVTHAAQGNEETALAEFQRHGLFLIGAIECALEHHPNPLKAVESAGASLLRRVKVSYKPKSIAFLSASTQPLVSMFEENGWGAKLILNDGKPFGEGDLDERLAKAIGQRAHA
jgi:hypothetical protein